ncbi:DUF3530 domain-containing protein [Oceanimonas pelagia]|uniref:DUF3530 domain-containing protein n=1 Tax=Oceanimonas pelagia TaxID=3028314 RepID=A0AA50QBA0_9GAMM|nr:DUF3530 domain-containing protein [Oceanimonas pelagia]WMC09896.1 DUF3530 domain-containing protein [Oceanimonas pelagia]
MRAAMLLMLGWLAVTPTRAQIDWNTEPHYQPEGRLLYFEAARPEAQGALLVWPELEQTHHWLAMAPWWQQRGWELRILLPDEHQRRFDPASEQIAEQQQDWLAQLGRRLTTVLASERELPQLLLTQGSATLWYQQLVEGGTLPPPDGQIVVDTQPRSAAHQRMLAIGLARSEWPVLDLFSLQDEAAASNRQQRQHSAARRHADYTAEPLHDVNHPERQIAAWLVRQGWLPLPPGAPDYLKGRLLHETGISRPEHPGAERDPAPADF